MLAPLVGLTASIGIMTLGIHFLGLHPLVLLWAIAAANIAGFVALLSTLTLERQTWVRKSGLMDTDWKTWIIFWAFSLGIIYALIPALREVRATQFLLLPLIASNGLMIPFFGVVQDRVVARLQRKERSRSSSGGGPADSDSGARRSIPLFARAAWDAISFKSSN